MDIESITKQLRAKVAEVLELQKKLESSSSRRYSLFPLQDQDMYECFKIHENFHWDARELDYSKDAKDFLEAKKEVRHIMKTIITFFQIGDGNIISAIASNFLLGTIKMEDILYFTSQIHRESIHSETYAIAGKEIMKLVYQEINKKLEKMLAKADNCDFTQKKLQVLEKYKTGDYTDAERYLASACSEGIQFCGIFPPIFKAKSAGIFLNFATVNELINRDENVHFLVDCFEVKRKGSVSLERSKEIISEFVEVEMEFVKEMLRKGEWEEITVENMEKYIKTIADILFVNTGHAAQYKTKNPFPFMDMIAKNLKTNFFELRSTNYARGAQKKSDLDVYAQDNDGLRRLKEYMRIESGVATMNMMAGEYLKRQAEKAMA